uniref:RING-type domain-containing protein n=1 Tax=Musa acuminata subsp. malaccensis TaxID=214687 RepID=A0A804KXR3_MUSAM|nr:PREDICTED: E3 ubiquitin-protein ligase RNF181-like [Musa acuminata subsp. malaccensis]
MRIVEPGEEHADEECPVCLDELTSNVGGETASEEEAASAVVREMPCRHRFHGGCIDKWLGMNGSCPVCRYRMPAAEEEEPK